MKENRTDVGKFITSVYLVICSYRQYTLLYVHTVSIPCYMFIPSVYLVIQNKVIEEPYITLIL